MTSHIETLTTALEDIIKLQPLCDNGYTYYPMHDGEGNYIGEQTIDPLDAMARMVERAQTALDLIKVNS